MNKNDLLEVVVSDYAHDGSGIAKESGIVLFIPGAVKGDKLLVRLIKILSNRVICKIEQIISPSPDRIPNHCPAFPSCGGCDFRHISYGSEIEFKTKRVAETLKRLGRLDVGNLQITPAENQSAYRNKAIFMVKPTIENGCEFGFYRRNSHNIVPLIDKNNDFFSCDIHAPIFSEVAQAVCDYAKSKNIAPYKENSKKGVLRAIFIRQAAQTMELMVCPVLARNEAKKFQDLPHMLSNMTPDLKSVLLNINPDKTNVVFGKEFIPLWGADKITDILCGLEFSLSAASFYQVNSKQCEKLYEIVINYALSLKVDLQVLDLFCGIGTISLALAKYSKRVIGIEIIKDAVDDATQNAIINRIDNATFFCGDADNMFHILQANDFTPNLIVVDPPRKGLSQNVCDFIVKSSADFLIYVSCNPSTLARDLKELISRGFKIDKLDIVDMFPRTSHVECVVLMSRL